MPNGTFNPFDDDNFITSDLQDHVILDEEEEDGRDGGNDNVDNDDDSDWESKKGKPPSRGPGRKRGRPPKSHLTRNGSSTRTSSGRVVKPTLFADDGEDYVRPAPRRKRGRPPSRPVAGSVKTASSLKGVRENTDRRRRELRDRCNLCNIVLKNDRMIVEHIRTDHVVPSMNPDDLVVQKTGVKSFLCSLCDSSFDARIKYKFHKRSKHGLHGINSHGTTNHGINSHGTTDGMEEEDGSVECDLCECILEKKGELIIHKDSKHSNLKTYHCDYCNDKYFTSQDLLHHRRLMHEDQVNKITDPWVSLQRDDILSYPKGQGYEKDQKRPADDQKRPADDQKSPAGKKSFPRRILPGSEGTDLPLSTPEESLGDTSSSEFEPDGGDDDDDDFDPSLEGSSKKRKKSSGRKGRSGSLESLGIEGLSKEGLEKFRSAPAEIQKKVVRLLADKRGRDAVMKRLSGPVSVVEKRLSGPVSEERKKRSISDLTSRLQATLNRLLEKKRVRVYDCPDCPHRFPSRDLLSRHARSAHSHRPSRPVFTGSCQICHDPIPNEKDYVQHLLSKHMTPDVDVLSVAAGILVKRVAKDPERAKKRKRTILSDRHSTLASVSNHGSRTHDLDVSGNGPTTSQTTIEPVIDDGESH